MWVPMLQVCMWVPVVFLLRAVPQLEIARPFAEAKEGCVHPVLTRK
jgi:hypothetical protein